jgi:hypothetical protein
MITLQPEQIFQTSSVILLALQRGSIELDEEIYSFKRYCLKQSDYVEDGWKLMICQQDVFYHRAFHLTGMSHP